MTVDKQGEGGVHDVVRGPRKSVVVSDMSAPVTPKECYISEIVTQQENRPLS